MRAVLLSLLVAMAIVSRATAQQKEDSLAVRPVSAEDSLRIVRQAATMPPARSDSGTAFHSTKSPGLALLFSAVLPGAGQFYNESYWKIPILLGFGYYFASRWLDNNDSTKHYRDLFASSITPQVPNGNPRYQQLREFYKDQRDTFSWYIFIYYIVNLVDAYVDASLYDFNVGDDLSIRVRPEFDFQKAATARLSVKIGF